MIRALPDIASKIVGIHQFHSFSTYHDFMGILPAPAKASPYEQGFNKG